MEQISYWHRSESQSHSLQKVKLQSQLLYPCSNTCGNMIWNYPHIVKDDISSVCSKCHVAKKHHKSNNVSKLFDNGSNLFDNGSNLVFPPNSPTSVVIQPQITLPIVVSDLPMPVPLPNFEQLMNVCQYPSPVIYIANEPGSNLSPKCQTINCTNATGTLQKFCNDCIIFV